MDLPSGHNGDKKLLALCDNEESWTDRSGDIKYSQECIVRVHTVEKNAEQLVKKDGLCKKEW